MPPILAFSCVREASECCCSSACYSLLSTGFCSLQVCPDEVCGIVDTSLAGFGPEPLLTAISCAHASDLARAVDGTGLGTASDSSRIHSSVVLSSQAATEGLRWRLGPQKSHAVSYTQRYWRWTPRSHRKTVGQLFWFWFGFPLLLLLTRRPGPSTMARSQVYLVYFIRGGQCLGFLSY